MKITFLISLHFLEIIGHLGRGDKINDTTFISNDISLIDELVPENMIPLIGILEFDALKSNKAFIYSKEEIDDNTDPELYLVEKLYSIQLFISTFWMHQDNNINFEQGFIFYASKTHSIAGSNFLSPTNTLATGKKELTIVTREILREIRKEHSKRKDISPNIVKDDNSYNHTHSTQLLKGRTRVTIALYHISAARAESDLGLKISHYCSSLEALFSSSQAELAHQLSERLAFFISNSNEAKLSIYRKTKLSYTMRSRVVHGATIKENALEKMIESSVFCDSSLRKAIKKITTDKDLMELFEGKEEPLNNYMLNLIFGVNETKAT